MLMLIMNPGSPEERSFALRKGSMTIGRTKDNDVFCLHKSLSRRHARIEFDGKTARIFDLQSKNGTFYGTRRVSHSELTVGDSFRCGDVTFLLERAVGSAPAEAPSPRRQLVNTAQTLPSPFQVPGLAQSPKPRDVPSGAVTDTADQRFKDKLFVVIRAVELLVGEADVGRVLDELISLAVQVLDVDRIVVLTIDPSTAELQPRAQRSFTPTAPRPLSRRVIDWVVTHGSAASFGDVSKDDSLPGSRAEDGLIHAALCAPLNPGAGTIGVMYADSATNTEPFRPDDVALFRALANVAAATLARG